MTSVARDPAEAERRRETVIPQEDRTFDASTMHRHPTKNSRGTVMDGVWANNTGPRQDGSRTIRVVPRPTHDDVADMRRYV